MLNYESVTKSYDGIEALAETTLSVAPGKTTVLIGPSGCGKSTLLRLAVGLIHPDRGSVSIDGEPVAADILAVRRRTGYVIQEGGLFPHLTVEGNAGLVARHLGWSPQRVADRLAELMNLTQLPQDALGRFPGELSGGQRQRVSLMRALMLDPQLLLLDEPLGALDPMIRAELQTDLRSIFRTLKKTVVLVTHDLREAAYFADHVVLLRAGRIVQAGTYQDLIEKPAEEFVERFVHAQLGDLS